MIDIRKFVTKIPAMRRLATATVILVLMGWGGTDLNATSAGSSQAAAVQAEAQEHVAWPHTNSDLLPDPVHRLLQPGQLQLRQRVTVNRFQFAIPIHITSLAYAIMNAVQPAPSFPPTSRLV